MAAKLLGSSTQAQWPCRQIQPPLDCCTSGAANGSVTVVAGGGMPGWQITLIAVGAALAGAALAILLDRAWATRKAHPATA